MCLSIWEDPPKAFWSNIIHYKNTNKGKYVMVQSRAGAYCIPCLFFLKSTILTNWPWGWFLSWTEQHCYLYLTIYRAAIEAKILDPTILHHTLLFYITVRRDPKLLPYVGSRWIPQLTPWKSNLLWRKQFLVNKI